VSQAVSIPVIASGGAGSYDDLARCLGAGGTAVAAASMFQFTQQTPREAKLYLRERGFPVRLS
jgi:imidazole glycerol-phosphate synthase subunit HisF